MGLHMYTGNGRHSDEKMNAYLKMRKENCIQHANSLCGFVAVRERMLEL